MHSVFCNEINIVRILVLAGADVGNLAFCLTTLSEGELFVFRKHRNGDEMKAVLRLSAPPQPRCDQCGTTSTTRDDGTPRRPMKCSGCRRVIHFCDM
jgi:hypothetical protein